MQKLAYKYDKSVEELGTLRETEKKLESELSEIESSLSEKLKGDMTADELIAKFKEIGVLPK